GEKAGGEEVGEKPVHLETAQFREHLLKKMPDYMVPLYFIEIDAIPVTTGGKVNRKALPEPRLRKDETYIPPGDLVENKMTAIWAGLLAIEKDVISMEANFFHLGGHSLKATVMTVKIEKEFNVKVPLTLVFKTPNIRDISQYIREAGGKENVAAEDESVILLRESESAVKNLFLVHDGSGDVEGYIEFCKRVTGEFNYWGIRADRLKNYVPGELRCRELAKGYIKKIKKCQPRGPYFLAGWSIGGTIAFEMAKGLREAEEEIAFLALIDTKPPSGSLKLETGTFKPESELELIVHLFGEVKLEKELGEIKEMKHFWPAILDYLEKGDFDIQKIKDRVLRHLGMREEPWGQRWTLRETLYYLNMFRTMNNAAKTYNPEGKLEVPLHYFGAALSTTLKREDWQKYVLEPVVYYEVAGDHFSILKTPQVNELAKEFSEAMARTNPAGE
ncbi:MAG: hypothetical protein GY757_03230, partial [bacterium]|nr:hypothetical protein [bacterium]